jgi:hypothetical protein
MSPTCGREIKLHIHGSILDRISVIFRYFVRFSIVFEIKWPKCRMLSRDRFGLATPTLISLFCLTGSIDFILVGQRFSDMYQNIKFRNWGRRVLGHSLKFFSIFFWNCQKKEILSKIR